MTRIMSGAYDAGFGDENAMIQTAAQKPGEAPVMVYMLYGKAPFALVSKATSPIVTVKDIAGRKLGTSPGGASLKLLPLLAKKNGIDPASVSRNASLAGAARTDLNPGSGRCGGRFHRHELYESRRAKA